MNLKERIKQYVPYNEQEENDKNVMLKFIDCFDDVLTRDNQFGHFTASSWIVNKDKTKVLMIYHNIYNSWTWTGGHADGDQDLLHVAIKEAKEETSIQNIKYLSENIFSLEIPSVTGHIKRGKYINSHLHFNITYLLQADETDEIKIKPDENSGVKWVDIDDVIKISTEPQMQVIFEKLNEKLKGIKC